MKNVLVIMTDQQRKDSLGCYGNSVCHTPNLDRLATDGIRFERNYVANPICMPNRMSLFTGMHVGNHGLWTNGLNLPQQPTIAGHFRENGYQTASIGKIHFTPFGGDAGNMESENLWKRRDNAYDWTGPYWGFEHVELTLGHTLPLAHYGQWFYEHGGTDAMLECNPVANAMQSGTRKLPPELHDSAFVADRTAEYIKNRRDSNKPFFLVASFPDPHHPFNPPAEIAERYKSAEIMDPVGDAGDLETRPEHYRQHYRGEWHRSRVGRAQHPEGISREHTQELIRHTNAMVELIDQNVGKILQLLEDENLRNNTIIVFTSDHGELLGDHGLWFKGPFFYEGLINTPMLISCPSIINPSVSETLFSDVDLAPTLCDLTGVPAMPYMDGISQMPHLLNPHTSVRDRCLIEYRNGYGERDCSSKVLMTDRHKYVRYQTGEEELTDLSNDAEEHKNVAKDAANRDLKIKLADELLDELLSNEQKGPEQISHA